MPIDVTTPPPVSGEVSEVGAGWWMLRLSQQLFQDKRQRRLQLLDDWYAGTPPLPGVARNAREALQEFHRHCRSNFGALIADAVRERQRVRGIRTSADSDATGDREAWELWRRMRMPLVSADALRLKARFGEASIIVSPPTEDEPDVPIATAEDPRSVAFEVDPMRPWQPRAGLKVFRDEVLGYDLAYLYRRGRVDVAWRKSGHEASVSPIQFGAQGWEWAPEEIGPASVPAGLMPLVPFVNLDGVGEFEPHLDLLRRINFMILQRLTIAVLQAFRQRGLKGAPNKDDKGNLIDYTDIFTADPGAIWLLPPDAEIWESDQVNLSGILESVEADVKQLSAVSRTPMHMMMPDGQNQSAEGASFAREGLVFKVEDRNARDEHGLAQVMSAAYLWLGDSVRSRPESLYVDWAPPQRSSLAERASALAQAATGEVPWRTRMIEIGEFDPAKVDLMETEREDDLLFAQRLSLLKAAALPPADTAQNSGQQEEPEPEAPAQDDEAAA